MSSGSVKFGLLTEMLKKSSRVQIYEQIATRLGNNRSESDIIVQVVALLDGINEETVFNKLNNAWEVITTLKKEKNESLNDFFSKFETLQYSLNLADTKIDFNKVPEIVFENAKTAIRDICNDETAFKEEQV